MRTRGRRRAAWLAALPAFVWALLPAAVVLGQGALGETGTRAYDMARAADDGAAAAVEEGERAHARLNGLAETGGPRGAEALRRGREEAEGARQALLAYRKLAQGAVTEALQLLAEVTRPGPATKPDAIRRDVLEERALLAAHEAAVMTARARAEAERLRAVLAETRLALVAPASAPARTEGAGEPVTGSPGARGAESGREVEVPNLVGARLDAARRDLDDAGLRLGASVGPREGFVVRQEPGAGARVPRQTPVGVTLSGTAATIVTP